jgi:opacity protein-like surface antigen
MKHFLLIALLASAFSASVFASDKMGETEEFECPMLAESNDRINTKVKAEDIRNDDKQKDHSAVRM